MGRSSKRHPAQTLLAQRIREHRESLGLSQMALAERCGMHFTFVSSIERGQRNMSVSTLLRLAEGLEVDPAELVRGLVWTGRT